LNNRTNKRRYWSDKRIWVCEEEWKTCLGAFEWSDKRGT